MPFKMSTKLGKKSEEILMVMSDFASIDWQKDSSNTQEVAINQMRLIFTRDLHLPRNYIIQLHQASLQTLGICLSPMLWGVVNP